MGNEVILNALEEIKKYSLLGAKNVLTLDEAALLTGLTRTYLYRLTSQKQIPFYKPNGRKVYFNRAELETWMMRNRFETEEEADSTAILREYSKG